MITHHEAPLIYAQALINPDGNPYQQLSETLVNVIQERGRPVKLVVRDQIMKDVFQLICDSSNMMIEVSEVLETIDLFVEELSQSMM
jgi:t-SNARE complex subunit (syntaxin)